LEADQTVKERKTLGCLTSTDRVECFSFLDIYYKFFNFHMENLDNLTPLDIKGEVDAPHRDNFNQNTNYHEQYKNT
jgi:hypothetical protein